MIWLQKVIFLYKLKEGFGDLLNFLKNNLSLSKMKTFVENNVALLAWFIMCNLSTGLVYIGVDAYTWIYFVKETIKPIVHIMSGLLGAIILVTLFHALSKYKIVTITKYVCVFLSGIVFMADIYTYTMFSSTVNQSIIEIVMTSDFSIIVDFFKTYFSFWIIPQIIIFVFFIVALYMVICLGVHRLAKSTIGIIVFLLMSCCSFTGIYIYNSSSGVIRDFPISRVLVSFYNAYHNVGNEDEILQSMKRSLPDDIICDDNGTHVILVLGESVDRNHMGIYGYDVNNTPYITHRLNNGEVYVFHDVISPANVTSASMILMFTYANKGDTTQWFDNANIFDIAKEAGYDVAWLSNQNVSGLVGCMDKIYSDICETRKFTIIADGNETPQYDEELLKYLDDDSLHGINKFTVIHLEGSHEPYYMRYPKKFNIFTSDGYDYPLENGRRTKAEYDNTILYTDYILNEIIKKFEYENVVVIYTSDHGSEVYDGREFCGHSMEENENRHMIEVPMFIWASKKYRDGHKGMIKQIEKAVNRPFMNDDLIYVLSDLLNITVSDKRQEHSILSENYIPSHIRYYNGKLYVKQ